MFCNARGVPYWFDRAENCYRLRPDYKFPALNLNEDELLGQAASARIARASNLSAGFDGQAAGRKISQLSNDQARALLADADQLVSVLDLKLVDHSQHREILRTIQWALLRRRQLSGQYASPYQSKPKRIVLHPYRLVLVRQAW